MSVAVLENAGSSTWELGCISDRFGSEVESVMVAKDGGVSLRLTWAKGGC
jgi:hypothetical protein